MIQCDKDKAVWAPLPPPIPLPFLLVLVATLSCHKQLEYVQKQMQNRKQMRWTASRVEQYLCNAEREEKEGDWEAT